MTSAQPVRTPARLGPSEADAVLALARAAEATDKTYPLSEDAVLRLRDEGRHFLAYAGNDLAGYAFLDAEASGELVVHPEHRRHGHGTALLAATQSPVPRRFWAHGDHDAARALAAKQGFTRSRVLWQMRRPLTEPLPDRPLPPGVTLRAFRPGHDDEAWLAVNASAFADHPEQGRWTQQDLTLRMAEPWFDPAGFLLAVDVAGDVLGFHWTKMQPDGLGEIYVLGVNPGGHRKGLGAALSIAGLEHLKSKGVTTAMLYVDESNEAAVTLYRRLGFEVHTTDVMYTSPT